MRIIAGHYRGQTVKIPKGINSRPTLSRIREALFNILMPYIPDADFLDVYAGVGSIGLEALSRGARRVVFIEADQVIAKVLMENVKRFDAAHERTKVVAGDAFCNLQLMLRQQQRFDIIFFDPPYIQPEIDRWTQHVRLNSLLQPDGIMVLQHAKQAMVPEKWAGCFKTKARTYGKTTLSFFKSNQLG